MRSEIKKWKRKAGPFTFERYSSERGESLHIHLAHIHLALVPDYSQKRRWHLAWKWKEDLHHARMPYVAVAKGYLCIDAHYENLSERSRQREREIQEQVEHERWLREQEENEQWEDFE